MAAYIRLSREDGNEESLSVSNQRTIIQTYLAQSFTERWVWAGEYVDDGVTGTDWERPGFQHMLQDIELGKVNCVVCKTLSRAFRNYADQGYFLESYFPRFGVRFLSLGGPALDSYLHPEALWGYEVPISGIMNDRYAGRTSMDVRRTLDTKRQRGEFIGAFAPYGYKKSTTESGKLEIDEPAAAVVRKIFAWRLSGLSCGEIVRRLNGQEILAPSAYKRQSGLRYQNPKLEAGRGLWSTRTVSQILSNPVYKGTMVQGRQRVVSYKIHERRAVPPEEWFVVEHTHPSVVDEKTFQLVGQLSGTQGKRGQNRELHLLSGLMYCSCCGGRMYHKTAKGYAYYACRRGMTEGGRCPGSSIREETIEQIIRLALKREGEAIDLPARLPERGEKEQHFEAGRQKLERLTGILDDLYIEQKVGKISKEEYFRLTLKVKQKQREIQEQQTKEREQEGDKRLCKNGQWWNWIGRELLPQLIWRVEVTPEREVALFFRFSKE